ncbi:radical SAM protein [Fusibacter sp. Q10-2]|uniref:Radical SAM protein n=2 Tax=Fusibacter ferrireducens TaxID=2785058 RepID=A0ABR9ZYM6_9FIRM|nr:radical SAM protein [Fusibacter ferrireducens]
MKKLLLIQPSPYDKNHHPIKKKRLYFVGLAMPLLAAMTPKDWEVEICLETIEEVPLETDAGLVAISTMGHGVLRSIDLAKHYRSKGKKVILGGYMASIMAEEAVQFCDAVVVGDAEEVWEDLLNDYESDTLKAIYHKPIRKLSTPLPRFDLILNKSIGDFLPVQAGRGCPNCCSFCSVSCLYKGSYIKKDLSEVKRDIEQVKALGFNKFTLLDDNIHGDRAYLIQLLQMIKPFKMKWMSQCDIKIGRDKELLKLLKESGCYALSFGIESISQESLNHMDKGWANPLEYTELIDNIVSAGIDVSTEMVVGGEGDTLESIKRTKDFIEQNKICVPRFYILTPIPGTKFFEEMFADGRILSDDIYSFDGCKAEHMPKNMSPEELTKAYWDLYNALFSYKSIIKRTLVRKDFFKRPINYLFYTAVNLFYRSHIKRGITPNIF